MTPYMRLKTVGGTIVNNDFVSTKKIGKWLTLEVQTIMTTGSPGSPPPGMDAEISNYISRYITAYIAGSNVHPFSNTTIFKPASTEAEYMAWMFMYPSIEAGISQMAASIPGAPSTIYMVTPEPTANDKIGSMDMKMVFSNSATGEVVLSVTCGSDGKPVAGTYSGSGTLQTPAGNMSTTLSMGFSASGPPSSVTLVGTTETAPITTVRIYMNPTTMSATGEVFDSSGTLLGTIEGSSSGGKVYIGGTSEAFTF
ncbi:MAG: hypothetical protein PHH14_00890 [Candidatus Margulisbacteria bacterium]|nr:hypothetical protein [Candidatus Margulisiibacteriota bacterium]